MTPETPAVNALVEVDVGGAGLRLTTVVPSRIEDVVDGHLVLAAPRFPGDAVAAELVQRRRYARASMDSAIAVVPVVDGLARVVGGSLLDLGEGGARARLELCARLDPGASVEVHLTLEGEPVALTGSVLRIDTSDPTRQHLCETVVVFDEPIPHGRRLRRTVLREQARARRAATP